MARRIPGTRKTRWGIAADVRVGGRDGKQYQKTFPAHVARYEVEEWRASVRRQREARPDPGTLAEAIDRYVESLGPGAG